MMKMYRKENQDTSVLTLSSSALNCWISLVSLSISRSLQVKQEWITPTPGGMCMASTCNLLSCGIYRRKQETKIAVWKATDEICPINSWDTEYSDNSLKIYDLRFIKVYRGDFKDIKWNFHNLVLLISTVFSYTDKFKVCYFLELMLQLYVRELF